MSPTARVQPQQRRINKRTAAIRIPPGSRPGSAGDRVSHPSRVRSARRGPADGTARCGWRRRGKVAHASRPGPPCRLPFSLWRRSSLRQTGGRVAVGEGRSVAVNGLHSRPLLLLILRCILKLACSERNRRLKPAALFALEFAAMVLAYRGFHSCARGAFLSRVHNVATRQVMIITPVMARGFQVFG